uniref:Uncharacterized protein n=1 Tax=Arion vulgaris TaxID=1028688 RepID=A0A0B7APQ6_9EUPU
MVPAHTATSQVCLRPHYHQSDVPALPQPSIICASKHNKVGHDWNKPYKDGSSNEKIEVKVCY